MLNSPGLKNSHGVTKLWAVVSLLRCRNFDRVAEVQFTGAHPIVAFRMSIDYKSLFRRLIF